MSVSVATLDDVTVEGRRIAVRIDVNSPLNEGGGLADDARLRAHVETLTELLARGGRVAILAHQGRPGGDDFTTLSAHADRLGELLDYPVEYVDATFSRAAREGIKGLADGEAVLLENTRFYSEEYMEFDPERAARTHLVEGLVPALDAYVNDAFAAAHRSQPSLVGFPPRLPSCAGRVMETELDVLGNVDETDRPRVFFLGGAKVVDALDVAWNVLERELADEVLTAGVVGNVFLVADGVDIGDEAVSLIEEKGGQAEIDRAADLLDAYGDRVSFPDDVAVDRDGDRHEMSIDLLPGRRGESPLDVGSATIERYKRTIDDAGTVVLNGPAGVFEDDRFATGTLEIYGHAATEAHSIVGGGDTAAALRKLGIEGFDHVSTGGGAALKLLTGDRLPAVEALDDAD